MAAANQRTPSQLTKIGVGGFKSLRDDQAVELRPLTILAGANSAGKSSLLQPLLLLKQTLEEGYDPGALSLNGPNVRFTEMDQLFWRPKAASERSHEFRVKLTADAGIEVALSFAERDRKPYIVEMRQTVEGANLTLREGMTDGEIRSILPPVYQNFLSRSPFRDSSLSVGRDRWLLRVVARLTEPRRGAPPGFAPSQWSLPGPADELREDILSTIYLPGLRGEPARNYPLAAVGTRFPGTFHKYAASIIANWKETEEGEARLEGLAEDLRHLELAWKVEARPLDAAQVEVKVARLPRSQVGGAFDLVNIADVGFGVSQVLPVLVALRVAREGQLVYLEQPEIHLHPNAQVRLGEVIADAAKRGVRVIVETHSSLLLLAVQARVAQGDLAAEAVGLHWFSRDEDGATTITSGSLTEAGEFGTWPEDFADIELRLKQRFIRAAATHDQDPDDLTPPSH